MVTKEEIIEALTSRYSTPWFRVLAAKIESEGIAPPDGYELMPINDEAAVIKRAGLEIKHD